MNSREIRSHSNVSAASDLRHKIAVWIIVTVGTGIIMVNWINWALQSPETGWDFPVFYIAGSLPLHLLYSPAAFEAFWRQHLLPVGVAHWAPYVRPSLFSLPLHPLAALPYWSAFWVWIAAGICAYLASVTIALRRFDLPGFLLPAYAAFFPAVAGLIGGADTVFLLLALTLALICLEEGREGWAAVLLTLSLCKFNLVFLIPVFLVLQRRYRVFLAFTVGSICVLAASVVLSPKANYLAAIAEAPKNSVVSFPAGLLGFSKAIGQPWCYPVLAALVFLICCWLMWRLSFAEGFAVAITGALLISPYVTWHDSTLLVLPIAIVFARSTVTQRILCIAILIVNPLWAHAGGHNGPIGFTHVSVEILMLIYFWVWGDIAPIQPTLTTNQDRNPQALTESGIWKMPFAETGSELPRK